MVVAGQVSVKEPASEQKFQWLSGWPASWPAFQGLEEAYILRIGVHKDLCNWSGRRDVSFKAESKKMPLPNASCNRNTKQAQAVCNLFKGPKEHSGHPGMNFNA